MNVQKFQLSLIPGGVPVYVHANQYDVGRPFAATILAADGSEYAFTTETVTICGTKPDGTGFSYDVTASGSTVTFESTGQMTVVAGHVRCGIIITQDSTVIGTMAFILDVQPAALNTETIISSDDFGSIITEAVEEWMDEHGVVIDDTLSVPGAAADAAATGEAIDELESAIEQGGLSEQVKQALLVCFANVTWDDTNGQSYYDDLFDALYPTATLISISAVYTPTEPVYVYDSLNELKSDLVVTAHYDDSSTETIHNYVLTGTLEEGSNTITVSYGGKTTTFTVNALVIPPEYQHVEYLESTGSEYIDTGIEANLETDVTMSVQRVSPISEVKRLFGDRYAAGSRAFFLSTGSSRIYVAFGNKSTAETAPYWTLDKCEIQINKNALYVDGTPYTSISGSSSFTGQNSLLMFNARQNGTIGNGMAAKLFSLVIKKDGVEVFHGFPCYRISDNEPGLYNTVSGTFLANISGSGAFAVGGDV